SRASADGSCAAAAPAAAYDGNCGMAVSHSHVSFAPKLAIGSNATRRASPGLECQPMPRVTAAVAAIAAHPTNPGRNICRTDMGPPPFAERLHSIDCGDQPV